MYRKYRLHKEAGFFRDWGNNIVGGFGELWRPVRDIGQSISDVFTDTKHGIRSRTRDWYHRNIYDPDKTKFSALERFLAGSAYDDMISRTRPVRVKGRDGRIYYRLGTAADLNKFNRSASTPDTLVRRDDGSVVSLAQDKQENRIKQAQKKWSDFQRTHVPILMKKYGYTQARAIAEVNDLQRQYARKNRQLNVKGAQEYLRTALQENR